MKKIFEEEGSINIPVNYKNFIYFLLKDGIVVYVGQTTQGLIRPFTHKDKDYDEMKIILCDKEQLDNAEGNYIAKYKPIYNKAISKSYRLYRARNILREMFDSEITVNDLKKILKLLNIQAFEFNGNAYINNCDLQKVVNYLKEK